MEDNTIEGAKKKPKGHNRKGLRGNENPAPKKKSSMMDKGLEALYHTGSGLGGWILGKNIGDALTPNDPNATNFAGLANLLIGAGLQFVDNKYIKTAGVVVAVEGGTRLIRQHIDPELAGIEGILDYITGKKPKTHTPLKVKDYNPEPTAEETAASATPPTELMGEDTDAYNRGMNISGEPNAGVVQSLIAEMPQLPESVSYNAIDLLNRPKWTLQLN